MLFCWDRNAGPVHQMVAAALRKESMTYAAKIDATE
jgi:hypothetical protein